MPAFRTDIRHWSTADSFAQYLAQYDPAIAAWAQGIVYHHTIVPTPAQWRGEYTLDGLITFYKNKTPPWDSGPHLFIAPDGIWQFTAVNERGIHAGPCNADHWGIEVCVQYDSAPWPANLAELAYGAGAALLRWRNLPVNDVTVKGHRDCNSPKSCPGKAISLPAVRAELARRLSTPSAAITRDATLMHAPRCTQAQALAHLTRKGTGEYTKGDLALSILPAYWQACAAVGLDPCAAIAQMVHETGNLTSWWSARPRRNPAGIGVTGRIERERPIGGAWAQAPDYRWNEGCSFADWANGSVPAHVGRLVAYATKSGDRTTAQRILVQGAMNVRVLAAQYHGCAPTLAGLEGTWAVLGTGYADKLAAIMNDLRSM